MTVLLRVLGVLLIAAGALALDRGGFPYTRAEHRATLGHLTLSLRQQERVDVPSWAGYGAVGAGVVLLLLAGRRR